jgi:hypothetical protein
VALVAVAGCAALRAAQSSARRGLVPSRTGEKLSVTALIAPDADTPAVEAAFALGLPVIASSWQPTRLPGCFGCGSRRHDARGRSKRRRRTTSRSCCTPPRNDGEAQSRAVVASACWSRRRWRARAPSSDLTAADRCLCVRPPLHGGRHAALPLSDARRRRQRRARLGPSVTRSSTGSKNSAPRTTAVRQRFIARCGAKSLRRGPMRATSLRFILRLGGASQCAVPQGGRGARRRAAVGRDTG